MAFLRVDKEYFGQGLTAAEILILAQVEELNRNGMECYMTDEQFAEIVGASAKTVNRTVNKLAEEGWLTKSTGTTVCGEGRAKKMRTLKFVTDNLSVRKFEKDNLSRTNFETDNLSRRKYDENAGFETDNLSITNFERDNLSFLKGTICPEETSQIAVCKGQFVPIKDKQGNKKILKEKDNDPPWARVVESNSPENEQVFASTKNESGKRTGIRCDSPENEHDCPENGEEILQYNTIYNNTEETYDISKAVVINDCSWENFVRIKPKEKYKIVKEDKEYVWVYVMDTEKLVRLRREGKGR